MNLRMEDRHTAHFWPGFADVAISLLLVFLFFLLFQFVSNSETLKRREMLQRQQEMKAAFLEAFKDGAYQDKVRIMENGNIQTFQFSDQILFEPGDDRLQPIGREVLSKTFYLFQKRIPTDLETAKKQYLAIQVSGHTDRTKLSGNGKFKDNWELSTARALAVVHFFQQQSNDEAAVIKLLSATGYSAHRPVALGADASRNRRIEIRLEYSEENPSDP